MDTEAWKLLGSPWKSLTDDWDWSSREGWGQILDVWRFTGLADRSYKSRNEETNQEILVDY